MRKQAKTLNKKQITTDNDKIHAKKAKKISVAVPNGSRGAFFVIDL